MKIKEVAKITIELSKEEWDTFVKMENLLNKLADALDNFGLYTEEYEKYISCAMDGIANIEDCLDKGFERETEE